MLHVRMPKLTGLICSVQIGWSRPRVFALLIGSMIRLILISRIVLLIGGGSSLGVAVAGIV